MPIKHHFGHLFSSNLFIHCSTVPLITIGDKLVDNSSMDDTKKKDL